MDIELSCSHHSMRGGSCEDAEGVQEREESIPNTPGDPLGGPADDATAVFRPQMASVVECTHANVSAYMPVLLSRVVSCPHREKHLNDEQRQKNNIASVQPILWRPRIAPLVESPHCPGWARARAGVPCLRGVAGTAALTSSSTLAAFSSHPLHPPHSPKMSAAPTNNAGPLALEPSEQIIARKVRISPERPASLLDGSFRGRWEPLNTGTLC